jgi:hypothetical protein
MGSPPSQLALAFLPFTSAPPITGFEPTTAVVPWSSVLPYFQIGLLDQLVVGQPKVAREPQFPLSFS